MTGSAELLDAGSCVSDAFAWIATQAVPAEGGACWRDGDTPYDDLYAGTAGVLLGCAETVGAGVTAESVGRVAAEAKGRLLWLVAERDAGRDGELDGSLFDGWAGVAVGLQAWARAAHDSEAAAAAERARLHAATLSRPLDRDPLRCNDIISGDAGTILGLLDGPDPGPAVLAAVDALADRLVHATEPAAVGVHWRMHRGDESITPGFSHGTAGVAYALAAAGQALGRRELIDIAVSGAEALLDIGDRPEGWAVPLRMPPRADQPSVFFGWCHGPTGTIRLFQLLDEIDPQPRWAHAVDACLQALRRSRLPDRLYPGYWDNLARCCGTAGVGSLLVQQHERTGDPSMLAWAGALAADVLARTVAAPGGVAWSNTEHTATPPELPPQPGLMQGAVGIAGWLARLDAALHGREITRVTPPWL